MAKKKPPTLGRKQKDEINKKALIWVVSVLGAIVLAMTMLLIFNR
jgi:hypothetical protein